MYKNLNGKTALVTGSGKKTGIGYAIARKLAACKADVIIADLGNTGTADNNLKTGASAAMKGLARELADEFRIHTLWIELDVTSNPSINEMVDKIKSKFSSLDILCNNAGAVFGVPNAIHTYDEKAWLETISMLPPGQPKCPRFLTEPMPLPKPVWSCLPKSWQRSWQEMVSELTLYARV
jgi:NAD(P)-dependent dehydrogenase (short-subunit alcohol dehydrogenase family)